MTTPVFLGLRATSDFTVEGQRPRNWREGILKLYPNGRAPLTALLALTKNESTDDPEFNWFTRIFAEQAGDATGIFSDAALGTPIVAPSAAGDTIYIRMAEIEARYFKGGHTVLLRSNTEPEVDVTAIVQVEPTFAGASSFLTVKLLMPSNPGFNLSAANVQRVLVIGSAHAEGALIPESIQYDPTRWYNYTQIFRNSLEITRTAEKTRLRTGAEYQRKKADTLEMHSVEMEKAFLFGSPSENMGSNGKPIRTTGGLIWAIKNGGGLQAKFTGTQADWFDDTPTGGLNWFERQLMYCFNFGSLEKLAFAGNSALLALNQLARKWGTWQYTTQTRAFGINVSEFVTPFGNISVKTHPLFSQEPTNQQSMVIFEPRNLRYRYITDTTFYTDDMKQGASRYDARKEEFLTEAGLEFHHPRSWAWLNGLGGQL